MFARSLANLEKYISEGDKICDVIIRMMKKVKTTERLSICLLILVRDIVILTKETDLFSYVFMKLEGVGSCIADSRKSKLTYPSHHQCRVPSVFSSFTHLGSEKDDEKRK
jgi:hypothetical protein